MHQLTIDLTSSPVAITPYSCAKLDRPTVLSLQPVVNTHHQDNAKVCAAMTDMDDVGDECAISTFNMSESALCKLPHCAMSSLDPLVQE